MYTLSVAARYARALLQEAQKQNKLTNVYTSVLLLNRVCTEHDTLDKALKNPLIHHDKKLTILQSILKGKVGELVFKFLRMISQRRQIPILADITKAFLQQYNNSQSIQAAHVTTTFQLDDALTNRFKDLVRSIVPCQKVVLTQHVHPAILGGYILQVADQQLDMSLVTQLHTLKKECVL